MTTIYLALHLMSLGVTEPAQFSTPLAACASAHEVGIGQITMVFDSNMATASCCKDRDPENNIECEATPTEWGCPAPYHRSTVMECLYKPVFRIKAVQ